MVGRWFDLSLLASFTTFLFRLRNAQFANSIKSGQNFNELKVAFVPSWLLKSELKIFFSIVRHEKTAEKNRVNNFSSKLRFYYSNLKKNNEAEKK